MGRRTWTCWRSSSQKAVNILSIASLLFRPKTTFVAAGELQIYRGRVSRNARRNNLAGYTAPALPMLSKTFRQVRKTGNSRWNGGTFLGPGTISTPYVTNNPSPCPAPGPSSQSEYGAGEMRPGFTLLQFVLSPLLDERVCPLQERSVMLLNRKNQESSSCTAMKEDTEWAVR